MMADEKNPGTWPFGSTPCGRCSSIFNVQNYYLLKGLESTIEQWRLKKLSLLMFAVPFCSRIHGVLFGRGDL